MKPVNQTHIFSKGSSKDIYNKDPEFEIGDINRI